MQLLTAKHEEQLERLRVPRAILDLSAQEKLFVRSAPFFSSTREEYVAHFRDVAHLVKDGDGAWFRGVMPWSLAIRMGTMSVVSHGGILFNQDHHIRLIDVCEFVGCRNRVFADEVKANYDQNFLRGQWYWGPMAAHFREQLDVAECMDFALATVGKPYGHVAIVYTALWHIPVFRELQFLRFHKDIQNDWKKSTPYCSMFQSIDWQKGGIDPCPGRALQLTSPQDTWQSLISPIKIGLIP